jgi:hypothetical protein
LDADKNPMNADNDREKTNFETRKIRPSAEGSFLMDARLYLRKSAFICDQPPFSIL